MSNQNAPYGFRPTRRIDAAAPTYGFTNRYIAVANTSDLFGQGDVYESINTGYIGIAESNDTLYGGIFWGCTYYDTVAQDWIFSKQFRGGSASPSGDILCNTIADPKVVFQCISDGSAITIADVGANATFAGNGAPNAATGISTAALHQATINTTSTFPFRIIAPSQLVGNDNASSYNTVDVTLNSADQNQLTGV